METYVPCPKCNGTGFYQDTEKWVERQCELCRTAGQVTEEIAAAYDAAQAFSDSAPPYEDDDDDDPDPGDAREIEVDIEDVTDQDIQPDVEVKPTAAKRISKADNLQIEVNNLSKELERREAEIESVQGELFKVRDVYDQAKQALTKERLAKERLQQQLVRKNDELEDLKLENQGLAADREKFHAAYKDLMDIIVRNDLEHILPPRGE